MNSRAVPGGNFSAYFFISNFSILKPMLLIISPHHAYVTARLRDEMERIGFAYEIVSVQELAEKDFAVDMEKYSGLFVRQAYPYFPEIVQLAKNFADQNKAVIDANIIEGVGRGKMLALEKLSTGGISIPFTQRASEIEPRTYNLEPRTLIVKWNYGFGGQHVFKVNNESEFLKLTKRYDPSELLVQEFIPADFEYKVITVGYKSLPVILKIKYNVATARPDFMQYQSLSPGSAAPVAKLAELAAKVLGRQLAKVDILEKDGALYVLEVNRWPGMESYEKMSGYNGIKDFVAYLQEKVLEGQKIPAQSTLA